jgi:carbonic anhydrase
VKDVQQKHERYLGEALHKHERQERLCELNVIEQVTNVCETTIVQDAWSRGQDLTIHGWVYRLEDGGLHDLGMTVGPADNVKLLTSQSLLRYSKGKLD